MLDKKFNEINKTHMKIPIAQKIEHISIIHQETIQDNYAWLRDRNWPTVESAEILSYLNAENAYYKAHEDKQLEQKIYNELKSRIKEEDQSYPIKDGIFYYFNKVEKGKDYPILYRKAEGKEHILLDCNILAEEKSSFAMGDTEVSEDHKKLAYAYDSDGSERYTIYIRDLYSNKDLNEVISNTIGNIVWNNQGNGFYYLALDEHWRANKVFFHLLGTQQIQDILIYHELDLTFSLNIAHSADHKYLIINSGHSTSNEIQYLSLDNDQNTLQMAIKRRPDHLYELDHIKNNFYILSNDMGKNFRLISIQNNANFSPENFVEIIPHNPDHYLVDLALYNQYIVVTKSILGLNNIEYYDIATNKLVANIPMLEEIYEVNTIFTNPEDKYLRMHYSSLTTPKSVLEYDFTDKKLYIRKTDEISGYDSSLYEAKRLWVTAQDGTNIPISMVYRKDLKHTNNPLLLYGYGSYGYAIPLSFRPNIISLLDRGFIYVVAHIRGGDELGYKWYESAKFLTKKLTFSDFITVAEYLIAQKYTSKDKLSIMGGSAGGMLMGVVTNQRPDLFKAVVALVPFVDVLNTMLDDSLPLTPGEFEEWGNPIKSKEYFDYIKSYSPYENVESKHYPHILATAGLTDPRVGYWEAAKWVAKLRANKLDNNLLLLKTEMDSGHKGQSGRFKSLEEIAMIYSFLIRTIIMNKFC